MTDPVVFVLDVKKGADVDDLTRVQDRVACVSRYLNARKALLRVGLSERRRAQLERAMREAREQFNNG